MLRYRCFVAAVTRGAARLIKNVPTCSYTESAQRRTISFVACFHQAQCRSQRPAWRIGNNAKRLLRCSDKHLRGPAAYAENRSQIHLIGGKTAFLSRCTNARLECSRASCDGMHATWHASAMVATGAHMPPVRATYTSI
jgi:hypothetical protein